MLLALCDRDGVEGVDLGLVPDEEEAIEATMVRAAADCDAVVTSGGVSMGDYDYVKAVLGRIGDMEWMQVAIKPAKPFAFGTVGDTPVFGLPGNPVSSLVSFELFARPGLRAMVGDPDPERTRMLATAAEDLARRRDGKVHFVRVTLEHEGTAVLARPTGRQGSHQMAASAGAHALAVVPDGPGIPAGEPVEVITL
jgi:molybdenum cofactor synthesis domain-containing protein